MPAFLFIIFFTILLVISSIFIKKSTNLTEKDKILSLVLLICFFSTLTILNEIKKMKKMNKSNKKGALFSESQFINKFIKNKELITEKNKEGKLTFINDNYIENQIGKLGKFPQFLFLYNPNLIGKSIGINFYLTKFNQPKLYIELKNEIENIEELSNLLKIKNFEIFINCIKKFNEKKEIPIIIFDNSYYLMGKNLNSDIIVKYLSEIFIELKFHLIFVSNNPHEQKILNESNY